MHAQTTTLQHGRARSRRDSFMLLRFGPSALRACHLATGWLCSGSKPMTANDASLKNLGQMITTVASQELRRLGYPLAGLGRSNAFDTDLAAAPDFRIGGILKEARFEVCSQPPNP